MRFHAFSSCASRARREAGLAFWAQAGEPFGEFARVATAGAWALADMLRSHVPLAKKVPRVLWRAFALGLLLGCEAASAGPLSCDGARPTVEAVTAAIFAGSPASCDVNGDGRIGAADLLAVVGTEGATPTPTPTELPTATPSACPVEGAELAVGIENRGGASPLAVMISGKRVGSECAVGSLATSYAIALVCAETAPCVRLAELAPGSWVHSVRVFVPPAVQAQHRRSLLTAGAPANRLDFVAFASVLPVTTASDSGPGSLRERILEADAAPKPVLIQFADAAFPPGVPTSVLLESALPALSASDVTIDGTDATGATTTRIIDAGGLPISALSITGARNHLVGLYLRNAGANNRDVLNISGATATANLIERLLVEGAASADGIGIDVDAGGDFGQSANVVRACEIRGAQDKGVKVTTGSYARVEDSWVHGNADGGIQATLGGHVEARMNLVEDNAGGTAQNGLAANASDDGAGSTGFSELVTRGNVVRRNGANGASVRGFSIADLRDDYLAVNGSSGLRVFNDVGAAAIASVEGVSAVCNAVDGAVVADSSTADFGGGSLGSPGNNAFTQNNLPAGGANLRNATGLPVTALNSQWENCGREETCSADDIAAFDLSDHGFRTTFVPAQAHRAQVPFVSGVAPSKGRRGEWLRIFGRGFNVIDGHFAEDNCADVEERNQCVPLRGNCVRIGGEAAPVEAVTPTMLVVRRPFTCLEPVPLTVTIDLGPTGATSNTFTVCTNDEAGGGG